MPRPGQLIALTAAAGAAAVGVWLLYSFDPNRADSPFPGCFFFAFTGWHCVSCGLTRALHALVHGDVVRAFSMNPLAMVMLLLSPLLAAWKWGWQPAWRRPLVVVMAEPKFWLVLLPGYWVGRNLPWFPFTLLAPG